MNASGTITMSMTELDRLKVVQAVLRAASEARSGSGPPCAERAAGRSPGLSGGPSAQRYEIFLRARLLIRSKCRSKISSAYLKPQFTKIFATQFLPNFSTIDFIAALAAAASPHHPSGIERWGGSMLRLFFHRSHA